MTLSSANWLQWPPWGGGGWREHARGLRMGRAVAKSYTIRHKIDHTINTTYTKDLQKTDPSTRRPIEPNRMPGTSRGPWACKAPGCQQPQTRTSRLLPTLPAVPQTQRPLFEFWIKFYVRAIIKASLFCVSRDGPLSAHEVDDESDDDDDGDDCCKRSTTRPN